MKKCYFCEGLLKETTVIEHGAPLDCLQCQKCKEIFFTSTEWLKNDILSGRCKLVRKFGKLGDSTIVRLPPKMLKKYNIEPGDISLFEERPEGILIRAFKAKDLKA